MKSIKKMEGDSEMEAPVTSIRLPKKYRRMVHLATSETELTSAILAAIEHTWECASMTVMSEMTAKRLSEYYTTSHVSKLLGKSTRQIQRMCKNKTLRAFKEGNSWKIDPESVMNYLPDPRPKVDILN